jgi:hypothetical protein
MGCAVRKILTLAASLVLFTAMVANSSAGATTSKAAYEFHVGSPTTAAMADNGDVVLMSGVGSLDASAKTASGGGTFTHMSGSTVLASGSWEASRLLSFQFYGCGHLGAQVLPPNLCGGRAALDIQLVAHPAGLPDVTITAEGLLQIDCLIGDPPPSAEEGVRLNVKDVINFNKTVPESGTTLFIAL